MSEGTDWVAFFSSLSDAGFNKIADIVQAETHKRKQLTEEEKELVKQGLFVQAITSYRDRRKVGFEHARDIVITGRPPVPELRRDDRYQHRVLPFPRPTDTFTYGPRLNPGEDQ